MLGRLEDSGMKVATISQWRVTRKLDQFGVLKFFDLRRNIVAVLFGLAVYGSGVGVVHIAQKTSGFYGPQPLSRKGGGYSFTKSGVSFSGETLSRTWEWPRTEMHDIILSTVPIKLRPRLVPYIQHTVEMAHRYGIDPFWVVSIMWTESHFNPEAVSHANAVGLMQIMPDTGVFITHVRGQKTPKKVVKHMLKHPHSNIELGVFYLARLLKRYEGNYVHATVAYNMGPGWVNKRLHHNLPVGKRNNYLDKVRNAYKKLSRPYRLYLRHTEPLFKSTLVYRYASPGQNPIAWYRSMQEVKTGFISLPRLASHL